MVVSVRFYLLVAHQHGLLDREFRWSRNRGPKGVTVAAEHLRDGEHNRRSSRRAGQGTETIRREKVPPSSTAQRRVMTAAIETVPHRLS